MDTKFEALISLLDDTDREIITAVTHELTQMGAPAVAHLHHSLQTHDNPLVKDRLSQIIDAIKTQILNTEFDEWLQSPNHDLFDACMILSKYEYPDINITALRNRLETMRIESWIQLNPSDTPESKVAIVNDILFNKYHFKGNTQNYHDPDNSFLNKVIETRTGNPISLCVVYMIIAQKLGMSVFGINLPEHFVLAYLNESPENKKLSIHDREVLFYINPFNKGVTFKEKEITNFLKIIHIEPEKKYYRICSNLIIINRITNNLIHAYKATDQPQKAETIAKIQEKIHAILP